MRNRKDVRNNFIKTALKTYIAVSEVEKISKDDYETELLEILEEVGIDFSR